MGNSSGSKNISAEGNLKYIDDTTIEWQGIKGTLIPDAERTKYLRYLHREGLFPKKDEKPTPEFVQNLGSHTYVVANKVKSSIKLYKLDMYMPSGAYLVELSSRSSRKHTTRYTLVNCSNPELNQHVVENYDFDD